MAENALTITDRFPENKYTLLIPIRTVSEIAEIQKPVMNVVYISTDLNDKEIYEQEKSYRDTKGRMYEAKYALSKRGLTKLMKAAGIEILKSEAIIPSTCQKCADVNRSLGKAVSCYKCGNKDVKYTVTVNVPQLTGENINVIATKEIIVEDAIVDMSEKQKSMFLKFRAEICESKALNRALRNAMNVKGTYTLNELKKPFVVAYLVPNLNQPDVRGAAIQSMMSSSNNLFGKFNGHLAVNNQVNEDEVVTDDSDYETEESAENNEHYYEQDENFKSSGEDKNPKNTSKPIDDTHICSKCGVKLSDKVSEYSIKNKGVPLCMNCQKGA